MTTLTPEIPVGQLVAERPSRARLFDRLGIDYCCGGRAPLVRACAETGLDVEDVLRQLAASDLRETEADPFDAVAATMSALADHIVAVHHSYLRRELPRLAGLVDTVARVHGERHPELRAIRDIFTFLKAELEVHMLKEEQILFPIIAQLEAGRTGPRFGCGSVNNPIRVLEHEHQDTGAAVGRLRELTGGYTAPADACHTYRALLTGLADLEIDLHRHIHKENEILFPRALAAETALHTRADCSKRHQTQRR
jgi:regulator of cell morphogenesis and NO signaling